MKLISAFLLFVITAWVFIVLALLFLVSWATGLVLGPVFSTLRSGWTVGCKRSERFGL